jgi:hypothetical protein
VKLDLRTGVARLKALARSINLRRIAGLSRGPALGVVIVLLFCWGLLVGAFRTSDRYYERRLVAADTSYYLMSAALVVSGKEDFSRRRVLNNPAPLHSSDSGTNVYVLQTLAAWDLRHFLPLRPAMAVVLNGIWFVAMAMSLYSLFWSRIGRWATSAIVTIAYLLANPFLPTVTYGITSMDPNLVGFMLGTSALCCTVLSDRFQRVIPSTLAGLFLGLLCLGRIYTLGIVLPAMLPYVLACFWRRSGREMLASLQGGLLALGAALGMGGWFIRGNWKTLLAYPTQYGGAGILNHTPLTEAIWDWLKFPRSVLAENIALVCVLSWPLAAGIFGRSRSLRQFNWGALWAALVPLLVLSKMGTTFQPYGAVSLFGVFLVLLFPFARPDPALLYRSRFAAALSFACAFNCWSFFSELHSAHDVQNENKKSTITALQALRQDALQSGRKRVTVGLVHWGALHDASLINALVFDLGLRVATPNFEPKRRSANPLVVEPLVTDPWAWDPKVAGAAVVTPRSWADRIINEADYVFVLAKDRRQDMRAGRWPPWVEASELISKSGVFQPLGPPFHVRSDGPVELLVRKRPRSG